MKTTKYVSKSLDLDSQLHKIWNFSLKVSSFYQIELSTFPPFSHLWRDDPWSINKHLLLPRWMISVYNNSDSWCWANLLIAFCTLTFVYTNFWPIEQKTFTKHLLEFVWVFKYNWNLLSLIPRIGESEFCHQEPAKTSF